jgi:hypothetical protein
MAQRLPIHVGLIFVAAMALLGSATDAGAQSLQLQVDRTELHAGLPFVLSLTAKGFDEALPPAQPGIDIPNCRVTPLGMTPNVSSMVQIVNGRRSESRTVSFVYRYRILAAQAGNYTVPAVALEQGSKSARIGAASFTVLDIEVTADMRIELQLPERPVWVGETFEVTLDWLLRRDAQDQSFVVPLFDEESIDVEAPPRTDRRQALSFPAGARDIELGYDRQQVQSAGQQYTRFRFPALVTVSRAGAFELAPSRVFAKLESGVGRDAFGFRVAKHKLFKAEDAPRRLSVRPLPQSGRPASFVNAIGTAFSLNVQASRTVAQVGDPIELKIEVRGDGRLEGLSLPRLDVDGGLDRQLFSVPDETPAGLIDAEGKVKTFTVTVRLESAEAREIPPLPLSYFDPVAAQYRTVHSQPIALSVAGSAVVGAADVVGAQPAAEAIEPLTEAGEPQRRGFLAGSLVGADLSLSAPDQTLRQALAVRDLRELLLALYLLPALLLTWRLWHLRTRGRRGRVGEQRSALGAAERAIEQARTRPARESAPEVLSTLRQLAQLTDQDGSEAAVLQRIETVSFSPGAADDPLTGELLDEAQVLVRRWEQNSSTAVDTTPAALSVLLAGIALNLCSQAPATAQTDAQPDSQTQLQQARATYHRALDEPDRVRRTRAFAEAEGAFSGPASRYALSPELLTDWGNAALGAQDLGIASLAYKRALHLDPTLERAQKNLSWLRSRAPRWLPRPQEKGAVETLFFWHQTMSPTRRHLWGAVAFAVAMLLVTPWSMWRQAARTRLAVIFALLWMGLTGSALLEADAGSDGVVTVDGLTLRSADSNGAPAALASPLPAGAEIEILEQRQSWSRIALADGTRGWLKSHAVERVVP